MEEYEYEVVLSFASEQRDYVELVANQLSLLGVRYFYDNHEKIELWGKNLLKYLDAIYFKKSRYCIMFISKEYKDKCWTKYESESIEERIFYENNEEDFQQYILPVRFDNTKIPGIRDSWGFISAQEILPKELAEMIFAKVRGKEYYFQTNCQVLDLDEIYLELTRRLPPDFISKTIRKSVSQQKTDSILLFENRLDTQSKLIHYDGKIFLDSTNKMWIVNLGFFNKPEILFEATLKQLTKELLSRADNSL